jgi:predicted RNA-binding Zn-ribbon protein involved in translation (DUF1610 family)
MSYSPLPSASCIRGVSSSDVIDLTASPLPSAVMKVTGEVIDLRTPEPVDARKDEKACKKINKEATTSSKKKNKKAIKADHSIKKKTVKSHTRLGKCPECNTAMVLGISAKEDSLGRNYLKCQNCGEFRWVKVNEDEVKNGGAVVGSA